MKKALKEDLEEEDELKEDEEDFDLDADEEA